MLKTIIFIIILILNRGINNIKDLNDFQNTINNNKENMIIFYSPSCPISNEFIQNNFELLGIQYKYVNCIETPQICIVYEVYNYPTILFSYEKNTFKYEDLNNLDYIRERIIINSISDINKLKEYEKFILTDKYYDFLKFNWLYDNIKAFLGNNSIINQFKKKYDLNSSIFGGIKLNNNEFKIKDLDYNFNSVKKFFIVEPEFYDSKKFNNDIDLIYLMKNSEYFNTIYDMDNFIKNKIFYINLWLKNNKIYVIKEDSKEPILDNYNFKYQNLYLKKHTFLIIKHKLNKKFLFTVDKLDEVDIYLNIKEIIDKDIENHSDEFFKNEKINSYYHLESQKIYNWNFEKFDNHISNNSTNFIVLIYSDSSILYDFKKLKKLKDYWYVIIDINKNDFPGYEINHIPIIIKKDKNNISSININSPEDLIKIYLEKKEEL